MWSGIIQALAKSVSETLVFLLGRSWHVPELALSSKRQLCASRVNVASPASEELLVAPADLVYSIRLLQSNHPRKFEFDVQGSWLFRIQNTFLRNSIVEWTISTLLIEPHSADGPFA